MKVGVKSLKSILVSQDQNQIFDCDFLFLLFFADLIDKYLNVIFSIFPSYSGFAIVFHTFIARVAQTQLLRTKDMRHEIFIIRPKQ